MKSSFMLAQLPWFKQVEEYNLWGPTFTRRRDQRAGKQQCQLREVPRGLQVDITWEKPYPGRILETYTCPDDRTLVVYSTTQAGAQQITCQQVYKRAGVVT
jgi:hypothetical protein